MSKEAEPDQEADDGPKGIFVTKGMQVTIPAGGLTITIGPDGAPTFSPLILHVGLDLSTYWFEIAQKHLLVAEAASSEVRRSHEADEDEAKGEAFQAEFMAGMQSIVASAIAVDAFYASVKEHFPVPDELQRTWREKRTARYKQTAEVLRRAFPMSQASAKKIRAILKEVDSFRGRAVHPPAGASAPAFHPELRIATEWRFVAFRFYNAKAIAGVTLSITSQLTGRPHQDKYEKLRQYAEGLHGKLSPLVQAWEERYGTLYDRKGDEPDPHPAA